MRLECRHERLARRLELAQIMTQLLGGREDIDVGKYPASAGSWHRAHHGGRPCRLGVGFGLGFPLGLGQMEVGVLRLRWESRDGPAALGLGHGLVRFVDFVFVVFVVVREGAAVPPRCQRAPDGSRAGVDEPPEGSQ
jgi:hypothetical protein